MKITLFVGSRDNSVHIGTILLNVLPKEASRDNEPCIVMQVWESTRGELCERQIYSVGGKNVTKGKKQKGENCEKCGKWMEKAEMYDGLTEVPYCADCWGK